MRVQTMKKLSLVLLLALGVLGCKPSADHSQNLSIDNFARGRGELTTNICAGTNANFAVEPVLEFSPDIVENEVKTEALTMATGAALSSIPESVRVMFFGHKGIIRISNKVPALCKKISSSKLDFIYQSEGKEIEACSHVEKDGSMRIYLTDKVGVIQHHLVRMFARVFSEVIVEMPKSLGPQKGKMLAGTTKKIQEFSDLRLELRKVFLREAVEAKDLDLSAYSDLAQSRLGLELLNHYVFAESFDSFYCSSQTRLKFKKIAPKTFRIFQKLVQRHFEKDDKWIQNVADVYSHSKSPYESSTSGFALGLWEWLTGPSNVGKNKSYATPGTQHYANHVAYANRSPEQRRAAIQAKNKVIEPQLENIQNAANNPVVRVTATATDIVTNGTISELKKTITTASESAERYTDGYNRMAAPNPDLSAQNIAETQKAGVQTAARTGVGGAKTLGAAYKTAAGAVNPSLGKGLDYATSPGESLAKDAIPGYKELKDVQKQYENSNKIYDAAFGDQNKGTITERVPSQADIDLYKKHFGEDAAVPGVDNSSTPTTSTGGSNTPNQAIPVQGVY